MSIPATLDRVIARLRNERGWSDKQLVTSVASRDVVKSGLVKQRISLGGYVTPMETAVDALLADRKTAVEAAKLIDEPFVPKAIYVCTTNTVDGVPISEDVRRPFEERQARPILIWRHLVENAKIDPGRIAVYCQLAFSKEFPPPASFKLFARGDGDYDRFVEGDYEHIIFNLGLQEGWDDPACGFAYIDKEMASARQITQVIGRVLRQPGARHYTDPILNTAHFYIRTDEQGVFESILKDVQQQLVSEHPAVELTVRPADRRADSNRELPSKARTVPTTAIYSGEAIDPVRKVVQRMMDFRKGGENTVGQGSRAHVLQEIGTGAGAHYEWIEVKHSNRVIARMVFKREMQRLYAGGVRRAGGPINLIDVELPKLDALVEINSPAAQHIKEIAAQVVDAFIEHSYVVENDNDVPYTVGPIAIDGASAVPFNNAVHPRYSGLNKLELAIAKAIDRTQRVWCRNPENSGYFIPLLDRGSTTTFYPDFLVWVDRSVVALDTKGDHLLNEDTRRKLFDIHSTGGRKRIVLRMISEGRWAIAPSGQLGKRGADGYTVWRWQNGKLTAIHCNTEKEAVEVALSA